MPSRQLLVYFAAALLAVAVVTAGIVWWNRGAHLELQGSIQKVRTLALDEKSSALFIDFRFVNPADYPFVVREVTVEVIPPDGKVIEGMTITELDAKRIFQYYPLLGPKYNPSLLMREKLAPKQAADRMISAQFNVPEELLKARRNATIRVREVDGVISVIKERE
jgi:hypothetical protein